jgi:hypothetical protein
MPQLRVNFRAARADTESMFKTLIGFGFFVGSTVGGFVPSIWGDHNMFGGAGILLSVVGGVFGIWAGHRIAQNMDL